MTRTSRTLSILVGATLLACALVSERAMAPAPAGADDLVVSQEVKEQVANQGRARVIVELRLASGPQVPEGHLLDSWAVLAQRASIASAQSQVLSRLQGRGHAVLHQFQTVPYLALEVDPDALAELAASTFHVQRVMEDTINVPMLPQSVPLIEGTQAWAAGYDGTGMMVAILDTGVDKTHPFLAGKVLEEACYSSGPGGSWCPNGQPQQVGPGTGVNCPLIGSECWHGTHVAGIAAGNGAGAGVSYSGVAKGAQIMAVQVFSRYGASIAAYASDIIAGFERVYLLRNQHNFSSVNLSVGSNLFAANCELDPMKASIDNLRSVGIATVIAAGNNSSTWMLTQPSCISSAVSVGSTDKTDVVSAFSNAAPVLSLFAPGGAIVSSYPGSGWQTASGTSMATPHVTGAWAVLKQAAPGASVSTILTALQQTGILITDTRPGGTVTKPRIRIAQALSALAPAPPRTLTVAAMNPSVGVGVAVNPVDNVGLGNGTTPFSRVYGQNTVVSLTAAATAGGNTFQKWQRDGVDVSTRASAQVAVDANHTLTAVYVFSSFVDVPPSHVFWPWIEALVRAGITSGCGTNPPTYCPDQSVTRGQMAVFLLKSKYGAGYQPPAATGIFADMPQSDPSAGWIERLFAEGITAGCVANPLRYCPDQSVTRGQIAVFLLRAKHGAGYQPPAAIGIFADVPQTDPFAAWIEQLAGEGIAAGCGTNPARYCPDQSVTRGQMAVFLVRTFGFPL